MICLINRLLDLHVPGTKYAVRFTFSRLPVRVQHRAVELADEHSLDKVLYPTATTACSMGTIQPLDTPL